MSSFLKKLFKSHSKTLSGGRRKARKTARKTKRKRSRCTMKRKRGGSKTKRRTGKRRAGKRRAGKRRAGKRTRYKMRGG